MIGLDTNVLVRFLTQDDPEQARLATRLMDSLSESEQGYVSLVTLVEVYWVLKWAYRIEADAIEAMIVGLLAARELVLDRADVVRSAMTAVAEGADFADSLIAQLGRRAGCRYTATFDRRASGTAGMQLLT